jgi:hypothetical protein
MRNLGLRSAFRSQCGFTATRSNIVAIPSIKITLDSDVSDYHLCFFLVLVYIYIQGDIEHK